MRMTKRMKVKSSPEDIIVISSDEEDDDSSIIFVPDSSPHPCSISEDDPVYISDDDDDEDLPDLPNNYNVFTPKKEKEDFLDFKCSVTRAMIVPKKEKDAISSFPCPFDAFPPIKIEEDNNDFFKERKKEIMSDSCDEPPSKMLKIENNKDDFVSMVRYSMYQSFLRGCLKESGYHSWNGRNHQVMMPQVSQTLLETMMADDCLMSFAIRNMSKAVTKNNYLAPVILEKLLDFLMGSEDKMEISSLEDFYLGVSVLRKQLLFHHPSSRSTKQYYLRMCKVYWPLLISRVELLLRNKEYAPQPKHSTGVKPVSPPKISKSPEDRYSFDFSDIAMKKKDDKKRRFLSVSRTEKLDRMCTLLKYFVDLLHSDSLTWFLKYWHNNIPAFNSSIQPILYKLTWKDTFDIGHLNQNIRLIFDLYCESAEERTFHRLFGVIIGLFSTIMHRSEKSLFPEMGNLTRNYALELYQRLKSSPHLDVHLADLQPDWLKFHIVSNFLRVGESPNFYTLKETIVRLLNGKDKYGMVAFEFDVETVCLHGLHSMLGMLSLHPSIHQASIQELTEENFENAWFGENLHQQDIVDNIKTLRNLLNSECVQRRQHFHCYGFEDDIRRM
ncbi:hypothetical protein ONE63_001458 [Megalurothrips usitatus]|uniref:Uncharacterized protein n=1 Tax=Megalurothrips usitatus TaxID=439358 RepID=A0AAV7XG89_9NEOP|nr:hypothetical protein ONE63_001458 [Megalurothrips usitatus]